MWLIWLFKTNDTMITQIGRLCWMKGMYMSSLISLLLIQLVMIQGFEGVAEIGTTKWSQPIIFSKLCKPPLRFTRIIYAPQPFFYITLATYPLTSLLSIFIFFCKPKKTLSSNSNISHLMEQTVVENGTQTMFFAESPISSSNKDDQW